MNQEKIGKFILKCRKAKKLTQEQLGEKIGGEPQKLLANGKMAEVYQIHHYIKVCVKF